MRLNKFLSEAGVCSRREADKLIMAGRVTVDGKKAEPGMQVEPGMDVRVGKKTIHHKAEKVVLAFHKPTGIICTEDKRVKHNILECVDWPVRVTYAGRLDKESEGLMILTNDGDLINQMMRARFGHEKEYKVKVNKEITEDFLEGMRKGVHITDKEKNLDVVTRPCIVNQIGKYSFTIILTQGYNRQIRRMCQAFDYEVETLKRVRIMNIELGKLKAGEVRVIAGEELKHLYEACKQS